MKENNAIFNINNIHSIELNLLDGQVDLILRSLELYGYNLEYMLNSTDSTEDDIKQEKKALLKYTYEQILSTKAEQVNSGENSTDKIPELGELLLKVQEKEIERKFRVV